MLKFSEHDLSSNDGFSSEKKGLADLLYGSDDKNSALNQRVPDASNVKYSSAAHIFDVGP